jgi:hypothetical protein
MSTCFSRPDHQVREPWCKHGVREEYSWGNLEKRYNRLFRQQDFVLAKQASREFVLRYLDRHGEREAAGYFIRNLRPPRKGASQGGRPQAPPMQNRASHNKAAG